MSVITQYYSIIIDQGISAPGLRKEVEDGLNVIDNCYIYQLMSTVKLPVSNRFDSHMQMQTGNQKYGVSLANKLQQHLTREHRKNGVFDQGKKLTIHRKKMDRQTVSCSG